MSPVAFDTNILVYLAEISRSDEDDAKIDRIKSLVKRLSGRIRPIAPTQALGELYVVLRRSGADAADARAVVVDIAQTFDTAPSSHETALAALDLAVDHKLQFWDALILNAAADAGCTLLLSEDMQHGFVNRGMTVINPLAEPAHPMLTALLSPE
jgi:predicted nucleic acid-binding protein